ncbi:MAG: hypothetical protein V2I35_06105 [Desulfocapsaceae bacterium]|jgi:hypothetical protein|nr:hypothetical protein [Desulfocapsaceae bacterium]
MMPSFAGPGTISCISFIPIKEELFMSIRALAIELYRAQQKVHRLQEKLEKVSINDRDRLRQELKQAEAECYHLRRLVDGKKEPFFSSRNPFKR